MSAALEIKTNENLELLKTRFGNIYINKEKKINFPNCILGMENLHDYCLADYPGNKEIAFKILQSIEDQEISFLVFPVLNFDTFFQKQDLEICMNELNIKAEDAIILLITSTTNNNSEETKSQLTVNVRAPIIIDSSNLKGYQYVFNNDIYKLQQIIEA